MQPVQLRISGLNSFIEEQTIDFSRLTEVGLFGIFGPTGSGKSTILDAITLALYGKVPRSGGKLSGIVNSQTNSVNVYYEFAIGSGKNRKTYGVQRVLKRRESDGVNTEKAVLYDVTQPDNPQVIGEKANEVTKKIEGIIGLNADDFTRSVVLPQGSFSEFLKLSGTERRNMLERIFGLEKYGQEMMQKIAAYKGRKNAERSRLEGLLSSYGDVSKEAYERLEEEIARLQAEKRDLEKQWEQVEKDYGKYQVVWQLQEELKEYLKQEKELAAQRETFGQKERMLQRGEKAAVVKPLIDKVIKKKGELKAKRKDLAFIEGNLREVSARLGETEERWKEVSQQKEKEIPLLLEQKTNLERAVAVKIEMEAIEKELLSLREEYQRLTENYKRKKKELSETEKKIGEQQEALKIKAEKIASMKIPPGVREQVSKAYEQEKEYNTLSQGKKDLANKISFLEENLKRDKNELALLTRAREEKEAAYQALTEAKKFLEANCPGTHQDLFQKQEELNGLRHELEDVMEWHRLIEEIRKEVSIWEEQKHVLEKELTREEESLARKEEELAGFTTALETAKQKNLAGLLAKSLREGEPCPVCGSNHHPRPAGVVDGEEVKSLEEKVRKAEEERTTLKDRILRLRVEANSLAKDICNKKNELESLNAKIAGREPSLLQETVEKAAGGIARLSREIGEWEKNFKETENRLSEIKDQLIELNSKEASAKMACEKDENALADLQEELQQLNARFDAVKEAYQASKAMLGLECVEKRLQEIRRKDQEVDQIEKEEKSVKEAIEELEKEKISLQGSIVQLEIQLGRIEQSGKEKRIFFAQKKAEVAKLCGEKDPGFLLEEVKMRMAKIEDDFQRLKHALEEAKKEQEDLQNKAAVLSGDKNTLKTLLQQEEQELGESLKSNGFMNEDEVLSFFIPEEELQRLQTEIQGYWDEVKVNAQNIKRISGALKGESIAAEEWERIQEKRKSLQEKLEEVRSELLLKEAKGKELQAKLGELEKLLDKKKEIEHQYGLLEELENLFRGKKFVEFIAKNQLTYIVREASKKLKDITRGRYALELNTDGEFVMRDDFNGGARRPTHTLSGGETFLTSLSLALALSSHIQLGRASLEFFFLDEGFGTLDGEILDVVMNSLERLHSEKLSVGIISHVEELKQRIPRKIIVKPAVPGFSGTRVEIEES